MVEGHQLVVLRREALDEAHEEDARRAVAEVHVLAHVGAETVERRERRGARVAVKCVRAGLHDRDGAQDNDTLEMRA